MKDGLPDIEELLVEALGALEDGGSVALDALLARHPEQATSLRVRIEELGRLGLVDTAQARAGVRAERMGDFRLIAELGGGGMGVVYEAEQISLGRRVALKLIRPELLWFGGSRARFRREIEAVARLSHPGIVPIYTVGEEDGVPFFAMELVEGCTLSQVIASQAGRSPARLSGADFLRAVDECSRGERLGADTSSALAISPEAPWTEVAIRIVRQVADALEHAHGRGVVHRDVKPSNIVVTRTGRAMLLDFGLASREGGEKLTRSGAAGGSVAYMSPEQVRGESVDARTDVYSLGVTFAELLTLEPVFRGSAIDQLWRAILAGEYQRPRQRVPSIPWDVETVCTTAMEQDRERRYATAGELAGDLTNLLSRRPIEARRAGTMLRALRWAQRHPRISATLLAASVLGLASALVYARQQAVLGGEIRAQRDVARERAKELRALATGFVYDVYERIKPLPGSTEARELIVTQMQRLFDALARSDDADPSVARDLAFADLALGTMLEKTAGGTLGQERSSLEHLERAWRFFDVHGRAPAASLEDQRLLVQCQKVFGNCLTNNGEPERGLSMLEAGARDARALAEGPAANLEARVAVAWLDIERGSAMARLGRTTEARELYGSTVTRLEELERTAPGNPLVLRALPRALLLHGDSLDQAGDAPGAARVFQRGIEAADRLIAAEPAPPLNHRERADCRVGLAGMHVRLGQADAARELVSLAIDEYTQLRKTDPSELQWALDLARAYNGLAEIHSAFDDEEQSKAAALEGLAVLEQVREGTENREFRKRRIDALARLALCEVHLGEIDNARGHFSAAESVLQDLLAEDKADLFLAALAAQSLRDWADMETEALNWPRALELHRECLAAYERWLRLAPQHRIAVTEESFARSLYAKALGRSGDGPASLREHLTAARHALAAMGPEFKDPVMLERGVFTLLGAAQELGLAQGAAVDLDPAAQGDVDGWIAAAVEWCGRILSAEPGRGLTREYLLVALELGAQRTELAGGDGLPQRSEALRLRVSWAREPDGDPMDAVLLAKELLSPSAAPEELATALELCRVAVERAPEEAVPRYYLAKALDANGRSGEALAAAREAEARLGRPLPVEQEKLALRIAELLEDLGRRQ
ncbi:MAG: serine/threonine protein kinase [Planctomycetes bacterium]|nr:serine/threonine protein kinase [Planctomycetota bacterium]